jgi:protein-S-isoprenylcysteine O-methyltransferase Ste14
MTSWRWRNVPLPEAHLIGLGAGILAHLLFPWRLLPTAWVGQVVGWPLLVAGAALAVWAVRSAGDVNLERPHRLVVTGPYRFSRNPMYVAWTLGYVGLGFLFNTAWPLLVLPAVLVVTHQWGIRREERELEARFGDEYLGYEARVRRYV